MEEIVKPNRCAWPPCGEVLKDIQVPTLGTRQFCHIGHLKLWETSTHGVLEAKAPSGVCASADSQLGFWPSAHRSGQSS